jgi:predicted nucleic acid-binding protein
VIRVLDASAAVRIAFGEPASGELADGVAEAEFVAAPDLFVSEVSNTMWKYVEGGFIEHAQAHELLDDIVGLVDEFVPAHELHHDALSLSVGAKHPVYDAFYVILARRLEASLATTDRRLAALAAAHGLETI